MKISEHLKLQREYVESTLAKSIICDRCKATAATYSKQCNADLSDACPGFLAIEAAKKRFDVLNSLYPSS